VGQLEVRAAEARIGLLKVETSVVSGDEADTSFIRVPTVRHSDGARVGLNHQIAGITKAASASTSLVLAETSGTDEAAVTIRLYDNTGSSLGQSEVSVPRYGHVRIEDLVTTLGGSSTFSAGRVEVEVTDGGGSVVALGKIEDVDHAYATLLLGAPASDSVSAKLARSAIGRRDPSNGVSTLLAAPFVVSGRIDGASGPEYSTLMGFVAPFLVPMEFLVTFTDASGESFQETVSVPGGAIAEYRDILKDLFGLDGRVRGSLVVETDPRGRVYARLLAGDSPAGALDLASPVSELVTMIESARPLYVDGLEQSTDPTRGARWNLYIRKIPGESGNLTVRLYEAGNRTHPIAVKHLAIDAGGQLGLETVFDAMEMNTETRRKDRTNVLCMVTPESGGAVVTAVALEIDSGTGTATSHTLKPASGLTSSGETPTLVRVVEPGDHGGRRRPVRR
jgi:hypothetical protein